MFRRGALSLEQALQKARHYCGYQERCHSEVQEKLYSFGLRKNDVEQALATLIEENYLNEERFALQFAGGRFRLKGWGRVRIKYELKQKHVSEYCIKKALAAIGEEDYERTLQKLAEQRWEALKDEENAFARKQKLQDYLLRKGYESDLVIAASRDLGKNPGQPPAA
ncbi:MAG: RecX family transcriptional regulator [Bacteroidetes bacterium]|nr:RecX family transcriptional regulator [Bacteroidota bacterium]